VNEDNKKEYVKLVCQMKMTGAIRQQLNAFMEGFYDIIPKRLISIFNEQELELLISGLPTIDIDDLKANTEYHKYQATSLQVRPHLIHLCCKDDHIIYCTINKKILKYLQSICLLYIIYILYWAVVNIYES
jgi:hypothetical protein